MAECRRGRFQRNTSWSCAYLLRHGPGDEVARGLLPSGQAVEDGLARDLSLQTYLQGTGRNVDHVPTSTHTQFPAQRERKQVSPAPRPGPLVDSSVWGEREAAGRRDGAPGRPTAAGGRWGCSESRRLMVKRAQKEANIDRA